MVFSIRGWASRLLFMLVFVIVLFFAIGGYQWFVNVISPLHPYEKPKGESVKVIVIEPTSSNHNSAERLKWFYWYGE